MPLKPGEEEHTFLRENGRISPTLSTLWELGGLSPHPDLPKKQGEERHPEASTNSETGEERDTLCASLSPKSPKELGRTGTTLRLVLAQELGRTGTTLRLVLPKELGRTGTTLRIIPPSELGRTGTTLRIIPHPRRYTQGVQGV